MIASLEDEQTALNLTLSDPDFYKKTPAEAKRVQQRIGEIETAFDKMNGGDVLRSVVIMEHADRAGTRA